MAHPKIDLSDSVDLAVLMQAFVAKCPYLLDMTDEDSAAHFARAWVPVLIKKGVLQARAVRCRCTVRRVSGRATTETASSWAIGVGAQLATIAGAITEEAMLAHAARVARESAGGGQWQYKSHEFIRNKGTALDANSTDPDEREVLLAVIDAHLSGAWREHLDGATGPATGSAARVRM